MLVLARIRCDLLHLGRGDVLGINPTNAPAFRMHFEHDLGGPFPGKREEQLDHFDHEFHRGVVVVIHDDLEHRRRLDLGLTGLEDGRATGFVGHGGHRLRAVSNMDNERAFFKTLQPLGSAAGRSRPPSSTLLTLPYTPRKKRLGVWSRGFHRLLTSGPPVPNDVRDSTRLTRGTLTAWQPEL